jgi:hypothetical protein
LQGAKSAAARNRIIDKNADLWGELKDWLLSLSYGKCWFTEAKDCFSHWDVEHYRPKKKGKDVDGTVVEGYWWLAFDWQNLRICGNVGNRRKGAYFPLRKGTARATPSTDTRAEHPALLDPADSADPILLFFTLEGRAVPAPHVADDWDKERVHISVQRYHLDFPPLMDQRKVVWGECWRRICDYLREIQRCQDDPTNEIARTSYKYALAALRELILPDRPFSAVARACIQSSADPRVLGVLRTA